MNHSLTSILALAMGPTRQAVVALPSEVQPVRIPQPQPRNVVFILSHDHRHEYEDSLAGLPFRCPASEADTEEHYDLKPRWLRDHRKLW
jgi:hypothetical protein